MNLLEGFVEKLLKIVEIMRFVFVGFDGELTSGLSVDTKNQDGEDDEVEWEAVDY